MPKTAGLKAVKKHFPLLKHLAKCKATECRFIIPGLSDELIKTLAEIALNVQNKNIPVQSAAAFNKLRAYKKQLKSVTKRGASLQSQRRHFQQDGGFLPALLGIALPVLSNIIGALTGR